MLNGFSPASLSSEVVLPRLRIPLVIGSFLAILYCGFYLAALVPNYLFIAAWKPDGVLRVISPYEATPAATLLQADDVILAIDGQLARRLSLRPLFPPGRASYTYTVLRGNETLQVTVPVGSMTVHLVWKRMASLVVAFGAWFVGALVVLFATPTNRDGWNVGLVSVGLGVVLAAAEAAMYGVPMTWIASDPFLPVLSVAYAQLGFIPRGTRDSRMERRLMGVLYCVAAVLGLLAIIEIVALDPQGSSIELVTGISLYDTILLVLAVNLALNPLILLGRYISLPGSYQRQQVLVLLASTGLSVAPLVLLTILPRLLLGDSILPWEVSLVFLLLNVAAYGYVILRRRYLELDLFATRTLLTVTLVLLVLIIHTLCLYLLDRTQLGPSFGVFSDTISFTIALAAVAVAGDPFRRAARYVVSGPATVYEERLAHFTSTLSADPRYDTLRIVFHELLHLLQVREAAMLIAGKDNRIEAFDLLQVDHLPLPQEDLLLQLSAKPIVRATLSRDSDDACDFFQHYPWAEAIIPLFSRGNVVGIVLLGAQVPDRYFNAQELRFIKQVADSMSVAAEASRLFESALTMSREMLRVRDQERTQLAAQIHDEPLQRVSMVAGTLKRLSMGNAVGEDRMQSTLALQHDELSLIAEQMRTICAGLRPPVLTQGIQWTAREVVDDFQTHTGLAVQLTLDVPSETDISQEVTAAVYHILVEALYNVHKHAHGSQIWVSLLMDGDSLVLTVEDNGCGTSVSVLSLSDLVRAQHFGIVGMHEWTDLSGGTLAIRPRTAGGTKVVARLPVGPNPNVESNRMTGTMPANQRRVESKNGGGETAGASCG